MPDIDNQQQLLQEFVREIVKQIGSGFILRADVENHVMEIPPLPTDIWARRALNGVHTLTVTYKSN